MYWDIKHIECIQIRNQKCTKFSSRKPDSFKDSGNRANTAEVTHRIATERIQDPKQRWSYHGTGTVFDNTDADTAATFANPLISKIEKVDRELDIKPVEVKPVAAPRSFNKLKQKEIETRPSLHFNVNEVGSRRSTHEHIERPVMPGSPTATAAPLPAVYKAITVEVSSTENNDEKQHSVLSPKRPPPTAPKPKYRDTQNKEVTDGQPTTSANGAATKPSLPPKPQMSSKPKTSLPSASSVVSPLSSPKSPTLVVEEAIQPVTSRSIRSAVPELPSSQPAVHEIYIEPVNSGRDRDPPTQHETVRSPVPLSDLLLHDLQVSPDTLNSSTSSPHRSSTSPVIEPEIQAVLSSRTIKTETTVKFFPTSPKPFLEPESLPSKSETVKVVARKILSPLPVVESPMKVSEEGEIMKIEPDISSMKELPTEPDMVRKVATKDSIRYVSSPLSSADPPCPISPPLTQGPTPFRRISVSPDTQDNEGAAATSPPQSPSAEDAQHQRFSLTLNVASVRQGPKPFGSSATSSAGNLVTDTEMVSEKKGSDDKTDKLVEGRMENSENDLLISVDNSSTSYVPPLPGTLPPTLSECTSTPLLTGSLPLDDYTGLFSPSERDIKMDGSASDSATLESQSVDSLEDSLDYISSSVTSTSNHSKTKLEIAITPSMDLSKPHSPGSSTSTLIRQTGDKSLLQPGKVDFNATMKGSDVGETSDSRASVLSSPGGESLSPSPTPSETDSGIGSNRSDKGIRVYSYMANSVQDIYICVCVCTHGRRC